MNYLRELLYRPRRNDPSLLARFYFADASLSAVASELDSFDGRKDPERCSSLVHKLRCCQDKVLGVCTQILAHIEPGESERLRQFRAKFPDDILTDNLGGQLWFGAECLAAGSSIMNKSAESEAMRPLAKAVVKSLEKVRSLLREQCLSGQQELSEKVRENLRIFDRLFADFELAYVQCMVHVKSVHEYELHQDLIVLFSETLQQAVVDGLIAREGVDTFDPALMFAIPRLALVHGLLICPHGPLAMEGSKGSKNFPELFLPFKNLLRKIKELLRTLEQHEVVVLRMLLCQLEEPANINRLLEEVKGRLEVEREANKLQEKLTMSTSAPSSSTSSAEARKVAKSIVNEVIKQVVHRSANHHTVAIDCTGPEIKVNVRQSSSSTATMTAANEQPVRLKRRNAKYDPKRIPIKYQKDRRAKFKSTEDLIHRLYVCISGAADQLQSNYASDFRSILKAVFVVNSSNDEEEDISLDEENNNNNDNIEEDEGSVDNFDADHATGATAISSGATVQNIENVTTDAGQFPVDMATDALQEEISFRFHHDLMGAPVRRVSENRASPTPSTVGLAYAQNLDLMHLQEQEEELGSVSPVNNRVEDEIVGNVVDARRNRAGQQQRFYFQSEPRLMDIAEGEVPEVLAQEPQFVNDQPVNRSIDQQRRSGTASNNGRNNNSVRDLHRSDRRILTRPSSRMATQPPPWVPDEAAPSCMRCMVEFTLFRRRHHCRRCGLVFCNRCSSHTMSLPSFGWDRPVRVCVMCFESMENNVDVNNDDDDYEENEGVSGPWVNNVALVS